MITYPSADPARAALYRQAGHWRDETIPALIEQAMAAHPDKTAVRDASGASLTYAQMWRRAGGIAAFLSRRGVAKGDIVTVTLPNWCETVAVFLGIMRAGGVVNPVPTTYGRADIAYVLAKCQSKALICPGRFRSVDFADVIDAADPALVAGLTIIRVGDSVRKFGISLDEAALTPANIGALAAAADDPVAVLFTSGTESRPKGAVHTHNTILFGERALAAALHLGPDEHAFMPSPISHTTGFMHGVIMTLTMGGTLTLLDIFDGAKAADMMRANRCTWTMGATPFLADVADALEATNSRLPDLRYFLCGGAPVPEALVKRAAGSGLRVLSIYGATESPPHTVVHPEDPHENSWTTDGRPLDGIEIKIVAAARANGITDAASPGEIGEEWSRGPNTFLGYLGEPDLTARDFDAEGWYHSGDLARLLPDGSIRIAGRLKDIIVRGGQNISVREVEDYLAAHPAVQMVAVVGMPHPRLGETVCAVVVTRPGQHFTLADATAFLLDKGVAKFKLPERLEVWPQLPATPSGKIQKFQIRRKLASPAPDPPDKLT
jgi:acyl-CoA synthetase